MNNEKVLEKDKQKISSFNEDVEVAMKNKRIDDLKNFVSLDFPIEIYSIIEEIIKESINAKGKWLRKFAANIIVTIGSEDAPNLMQGKRLCLNLLKELDEVDIKMLFLYEVLRKATYEKDINKEEINLMDQELRKELLNDTSIYAQTILTSSTKLKNLGLIEWECSLKPFDGLKGNKKEMIENFLSLNQSDATAHYKELKKYLYTMAG